MNQSRMNPGDEGESRRDPNEIKAEIDETRSAIAGDIRELGEKLSPDNLKAGAKHVIQEAKEEVKGTLREAKDAAVDSLRTAKDHAIDSVSETVSEVGYRARRAGVATAGFVTANAVPLTLIGLGAGWLMMTMRRQRQLREQGPYSIGYDERLDFGEERFGYGRERGWSEGPFGREPSQLLERGRDKVDELTERAGQLTDRAKQGAMHMRDKVQHTMSDMGERAGELGHEARMRMMQVEHRTRDFAYDNPLAVGAIAVAAGVGIGLALPTSRTENRLLGPTRGRLGEQARDLMGEARSTAQHTAQRARQAVDELKQAVVTQPGAPR
jgi:ElaB/YqjD/DUF883 family membrane-anchored ribosome-binding protein